MENHALGSAQGHLFSRDGITGIASIFPRDKESLQPVSSHYVEFYVVFLRVIVCLPALILTFLPSQVSVIQSRIPSTLETA
jgi:hypothetical protein